MSGKTSRASIYPRKSVIWNNINCFYVILKNRSFQVGSVVSQILEKNYDKYQML